MIRRRIPAGTVIHIHGIPFELVYDAIIAGHPANFGEQFLEGPPIAEWLENMRRPWWKRLLGIR